MHDTQHVRRILKVYRKATAEDFAHGIEWYDRAKREARGIAKETGLALRTVVGVMAALSPNNRWERNVKDTKTMCLAYVNEQSIHDFKVSTYGANKEKAWSMLNEGLDTDENLLTKLNGQKTRSFYSNIMGLDEVTVDGHAYNIATGVRRGLTDGSINISKGVYRQMQAAYVRAAKIAGIQPHEMQAITWTTWRREHGI